MRRHLLKKSQIEEKKRHKYRNRKSETRPKIWNTANIVKFKTKSNKPTLKFRFFLNNIVIILITFLMKP